MTLWDAETLARNGTPVQKTAWPASKVLIFSTGKGSARAVPVIREAGVERPLRDGDLTISDYTDTTWKAA